MSRKHAKKIDVINGRISLLFFGLLLFWELLWLERFARYRYDLIFRPMLIWLLPVLFGLAAGAFAFLLVLRLKRGKSETNQLFSISFLLPLPIPLMAAFLFPWLTLFATGLQFFSLATQLVFYAALGGFAGYIGYYKAAPFAAPLAAVLTLDILSLIYYYERFLSPSFFILNTEEFGYLDGWMVGLMLIAAVGLGNLFILLFNRKGKARLRLSMALPPAGLTILLLAVNILFRLPLLPIRILIFGGVLFIIAWYCIFCALKNRKKD